MGPDRNLRRLVGGAARAWLALESPATAEEVVQRDPSGWRCEPDDDGAASALALLAADGLIEAAE